MDKRTLASRDGAVSIMKRVLGSWKIILVIAVGALIILASSLGSGTDSTDTKDATEVKIKEMCSSLVGVGECRVMVTYSSASTRYGVSTEARVESVAIVCRGADKASVRAEITAMLSALYGIGANRIFISKMK